MTQSLTLTAPRGIVNLALSLNLRDAASAVDFYQRAVGAFEPYRMPAPDGSGKVLHGGFQVGDTVLKSCDEDPSCGA